MGCGVWSMLQALIFHNCLLPILSRGPMPRPIIYAPPWKKAAAIQSPPPSQLRVLGCSRRFLLLSS
eukprot:9221646-Pyramimonas_sp.AAC.1